MTTYVYMIAIEGDPSFIHATSTSAVDDDSLYGGLYTVALFSTFEGAKSALISLVDLDKNEFAPFSHVVRMPEFALSADPLPKVHCKEAWEYVISLAENAYARQTYSIYKVEVEQSKVKFTFEFDSWAPTLTDEDLVGIAAGDVNENTKDLALKFLLGTEADRSATNVCYFETKCIDDDGEMKIFHATITGPAKTIEMYRRAVARWYLNSGEPGDTTNQEKWSEIDGPFPRD